jgi:hypothetical protein
MLIFTVNYFVQENYFMEKGLKLIGIFLFILLVLTSCDSFSKDAGTFAVKFSWAKDDAGNSVKPDIASGEFFVTVRIYEWKDDVVFPGDIAANGKQLTQSDVAQMKATGTSIDFGDLSYGERRFVVAEIRKGEELTNSVLFTGMSTLFELKAGKHTEVNVEMKLTPTPGVDEEGNRIDAELRIVDDNGNLRSYTSGNDLKVKLRLLNAVSFTHVYFANKEENLKTPNGKYYKIENLKDIKDIDNGYELDREWDLSFGLTNDEIAVSPELKVYARLENEYGTGLLVMTKIALDNEPPELTLGLNPAYTNGSKAITLNISANELIRHDTLNIQTSNPKLAFDCPAPTKNESLSFTCTVETLDAALKDGDYEITVTASDQAGNSVEDKTTLTVDRESPELTFSTFKNGFIALGSIYLKENDNFEVRLSLTKEPAEDPEVRLGDSELSCEKTDNLKYNCAATIKKSTHSEGISDLSVSYQDKAENRFSKTVVSGIRLDYTPPILTFKKSKESAYNATDQIILAVSANEELSKIAINGENLSASETSWSITGDNITGTHEIFASATDIAGNTLSEAVIGTYTVDADYPDATVSAPDPDRISGDGLTTVTVSDPTKEIANVKMNGVDCEEEAELFICSFVPSSGTGDETESLSVSFSDLAGNSVIKTAGTVYVDRTPPQIAGDPTVILKKPAGCPLDSVSAVTSGSSVEISFIVNENLSETDPVVRAVNGTNVVDFTFSGQIGYLFTYFADIDATALEDGEYVFEIEMFDEVLNTAEIKEISGFVLDKTKPESPKVNEHEKIIYRRIPWGSEETGGKRYFSIVSAENSVDISGSYVVAFDSELIEEAEVVGKSGINVETASFAEMELTVSDRKSLYIATYDKSCNYSDPVKVENIEWTASLNGKVPGDDFSNPHFWFTTSNHNESALFTKFQNETPAPDGSEIKASGTTYIRNNRKYDMFKDKYDSIDMNYTYPMVHDRARGVVVMYAVDSTWEWDGLKWREMPIDSPPGAPFLKGHALSYDTVSGKTILFGGTGFISYPEPYGTWEYDGFKWVMTTTECPPKRYNHSMVYDENRGVTVLYGGYGFNDTWEYKEGKWIQTDSDGPSKSLPSLFYDPVSQRVLMFGGSDSDEMYEYRDFQWHSISPPSKPSARSGALTVYSSKEKGVILYGGTYTDGSMTFLTDTWFWRGHTWTKTATAGPSFVLSRMNITADPLNGEVVMFRADDSNNHVWFYSGNTWYKQEKADFKSSGQNVWDENRKRVVKFIYSCGATFTNPQSCTWEWNGKKWSKVHDMTQGDPGPKSKDDNFNLIYDCVNNKTLLLITDKATNLRETWSWNGSSWTKLSVTSAPYPQQHASWACDSSNNRVVIWDRGMNVWNGTSWSNPATTGYPNIHNQRIAYSPIDNKIYAHGGYEISGGVVFSDDLWVLNGTVWSKAADTGIFRYNHSMLINPDDGSFVLSGGIGEGNVAVLDVNKWSNGKSVSLYYGDHSISNGAFRYDSSSKNIVIDSGEIFNEISTYNVKPAQIGSYSLRSAQIEEGNIIYELKISANVSGIGYTKPNCDPVEGAFIDVWINGNWVSTASTGSSGSEISGIIRDPDILSTIQYSANNLVSIALRPISDSGCGSLQGSIAVSHPEITVKYINDENAVAPHHDITEQFSVNNDLKTWHEARNECLSQGGDLAVVDSLLKQKTLERILESDKSYWIGATDEAQEGNWKWVNGNNFWNGDDSGYQTGYHNWRSHQPDNHNGAQNYAKIWGGFSYQWDDDYSSAKEFYICEFEK